MLQNCFILHGFILPRSIDRQHAIDSAKTFLT